MSATCGEMYLIIWRWSGSLRSGYMTHPVWKLPDARSPDLMNDKAGALRVRHHGGWWFRRCFSIRGWLTWRWLVNAHSMSVNIRQATQLLLLIHMEVTQLAWNFVWLCNSDNWQKSPILSPVGDVENSRRVPIYSCHMHYQAERRPCIGLSLSGLAWGLNSKPMVGIEPVKRSKAVLLYSLREWY